MIAVLQYHYHLTKSQIRELTFEEISDRLEMLSYVSPYGKDAGKSPPLEYTPEEQKKIAEQTRKKLEELNK